MKMIWDAKTFESLLEAAPDAMVVVDGSGTIVFVNGQTEKVFAYDRNELVGEPIETLLPARFRERHIGQRNGYFAAPHVRPMGASMDLFGRRKDGSEFPVEISLSPLPTSQGLLVTSSIRDVTDRKRIQSELKIARETADAANRSKSEFLANMSHEIRTPLAGILGYVEMLAHYCKTDAERKDYGAKIKRNADNLTDLINDILDLSKVEAGALKIEQLAFAPLVELESVLSLLEGQVNEKGLAVEMVVERPIPAKIVSDPKRLHQVLVNLIGNAIKFTDSGKITVTVRLAKAPSLEAGLLCFEVRDTGCGISVEAQAQLFQPFVQADSSTTRKYGGTGLGLALSRRLAKALGGNLVLTSSEPGQGSVFTLSVAPGSLDALRLAESLESPLADAVNPFTLRLDGVRVLLAEDHADNEELVTKFLNLAGAIVEVARNGAEAVELAGAKAFDVVLMDLQMPLMDGYAATASLRQSGYTKPIIALTAHAMIEEKEKCYRAGCSDFLTKPIDVSALLHAVKRHFQKGR